MKTKIWIPLGALLLAANLSAGLITYTATMNGPSESPSNASPGIGFAVISIDTTLNILNIVTESFSGLTSPATASHIHCCTVAPGAGTAIVATQIPTFTGFPTGGTSGTYFMSFDMTLGSTWNPAFITANGGTAAGAEAALAAGAALGEAYLNIHSTNFGSGEIRGFLVATPEPDTLALAIAALAGIFLVAKLKVRSV
jgi:hypothetical protein